MMTQPSTASPSTRSAVRTLHLDPADRPFIVIWEVTRACALACAHCRADAITRRFGATSPILIDVTTEKHYAQPGCSRLKVTFWQDGVLLPGATTPRRQTMDFGINYCLDGRPPQSLK